MIGLLAALCFPLPAFAQRIVSQAAPQPQKKSARQQSAQEMPSEHEISELLNKATEKVVGFETAVKIATPYLDQANPKLAGNYLDAAKTAHTLIETTLRDGPSAYRLVSIMATLNA